MMRRGGRFGIAAALAMAAGAMMAGGALPALGAEADYTLTIKNHRFEPTEVVIPAGKKITLVVKNLDPTPEEFESTELHREKVVEGGGVITVFLGPLPAGTYKFFGDFNPSTAQGRIVVK